MRTASLVRMFAVLLVLVVGCNSAAPTKQPSAAAPGGQAAQPAPTKEPIEIGVALPITGNLSQAGQAFLNGINLAVDDFNKKGVLGRQVKPIVEDTGSSANAAAAAANKLLTQNKVFALVGTYGSTPAYAMLKSIKNLQPLVSDPNSSTDEIENEFANEPWYFHVYAWEHIRQTAAVAFLSGLNPKPKQVAIAHEDGAYGTTAAKLAKQHLEAAGIKVVMTESFKSGSPDLSAVLNNVKRSGADAFFWIAYAGDNILMARQSKQLGVRPPVMLFVGASEKAADFGDTAEGIFAIQTWSATAKTAGLQDYIDRYKTKYNVNPVGGAAQGYAAMATLLQGIETAGVLDKQKVIEAMEKNSVWTPFGELKYSTMGQDRHQLLTDKEMVVEQYQKGVAQAVYPAARSSAPVIGQ